MLAGYKTVKQALVNYAEEFGDREISPIFRDTSQEHGIQSIPINHQYTIPTVFEYSNILFPPTVIEGPGSVSGCFRLQSNSPEMATRIMIKF